MKNLFARKTITSFQPLEDHLKHVYELMIKILQENAIKIDTQTIKLIAFLHDCGKATEVWQKNFPNVSRFPHALLSLPLAYALLKKNKIEDTKALLILSIILSHHKPFTQDIYEGEAIGERIVSYEDEIFSILKKNNLEISKGEINNFTPLNISEKLLTEIFGKGLCRNKEFIEKFWKLQGALIEADFLDVGMWKDKISYKDFYYPFQQFELSKKPEGEYVWQKECINDAKFIFIPMPTGTGKTEAALFWAQNHNPKRIFYVLPVTFAINAMFKRFEEYFQKNVGIYHHWADVALHVASPDLLDNYLYFKHMLFPVQIITPDQVILSFLHWKRWTVKLFSFFNSVFIFDEIHTYDPLLFSHFRILVDKLENQFNAKICIITATLPQKLFELNTFEHFARVPKNWQKYYERRYIGEIKYKKELLVEWLEKNVEKFEKEWKNKKILIVVNTVERAQEIYKKFFQNNPRAELIHSRFILKDRINKEKSILEGEKKVSNKILIATQIIEVSLDIDYDILLTELAPIDSLIQRMGRVNRKRERKGEVIIFEVPSHEPYLKEIMDFAREEIENLVGRKSDWENFVIFNRYFEKIFPKFFSEKSETWYKAQEIWKEFYEDIGAFTSPEEILSGLIRKINIISIEAIPQPFIEKLHKIKEEAKNLWEKARKELDEEKRKEAIEKEIEIRKHVVEIPYYMIKDKVWTDEYLNMKIIEADYNEKLGVIIRDSYSHII